MSFLYVSNVNLHDRFDQIGLQMDNGSYAVLRKGHTYDLSASELARARKYVVMTDSSLSPEAPGTGNAGSSGSGFSFVATNSELSPPSSGHPVVLVLSDSAASGGTTLRYWDGNTWSLISGGASGNVETYVWDATAGEYVLLNRTVRTFVGPTNPPDVGWTMQDTDVWDPTGS